MCTLGDRSACIQNECVQKGKLFKDNEFDNTNWYFRGYCESKYAEKIDNPAPPEVHIDNPIVTKGNFWTNPYHNDSCPIGNRDACIKRDCLDKNKVYRGNWFNNGDGYFRGYCENPKGGTIWNPKPTDTVANPVVKTPNFWSKAYKTEHCVLANRSACIQNECMQKGKLFKGNEFDNTNWWIRGYCEEPNMPKAWYPTTPATIDPKFNVYQK
jgi:hypothetical protein